MPIEQATAGTIEADDPWVRLNRGIESLGQEFERYIGYSSATCEEYERRLGEMLLKALCVSNMVSNGQSSSVVFSDDGWVNKVLSATVDPGRNPTLGAFGSYGGRPPALVIRNGPHPHSVWTLMRIRWDTVVRVATRLLEEGRLKRDDAYILYHAMIPRGAYIARC
ncbi:hypothetical protein [Ottowia sp.]|uniref:hypothetical protein n=1 Tax=Ottowia sp. TaxID=1898956 RepID=UPI0025FD0580|nr:hypothetical protein [Ottowia sp.]MBK6616402.1 hypothetical protein [Ottowia sp.]